MSTSWRRSVRYAGGRPGGGGPPPGGPARRHRPNRLKPAAPFRGGGAEDRQGRAHRDRVRPRDVDEEVPRLRGELAHDPVDHGREAEDRAVPVRDDREHGLVRDDGSVLPALLVAFEDLLEVHLLRHPEGHEPKGPRRDPSEREGRPHFVEVVNADRDLPPTSAEGEGELLLKVHEGPEG